MDLHLSSMAGLLSCIVVMAIQHFSLTCCFIQIDLGGHHWLVSSKSKGITRNASVPGSVYSDLLPDTGKFSPLYRDNDIRYKWIGRTDWNYTSTFYVSDGQASAKEISLVCEGLDTIASIYINDQWVGDLDNMFMWLRTSVASVVMAGHNTIRVDFKSPVLEAASRVSQYSYTIPPVCPPDVQHGECHVNLIRKEQCSFSWDWGPSFPTQGIWRPIYLQIFDSAILTNIAAVTRKVNDQWVIILEANLDVVRGSKAEGQLEVTLEELGLRLSKTVTVTTASNKIKVNLTIPKSTDVPLWWPHGYGDQKLFNVSVTFTSGTDLTSKSQLIGFRTVELIQEPVVLTNLSKGLTFYFKINGLPIFLKGSNWIPADNFQENITPDQVRYLLQSAVDVGMNAMRVWGGGIYESNYFYSVADELGILIWQDLMFSVALYPGHGHFLDSVALEVKQQLQRLKHHPCILLWAGSNENEKALRQDWFHVAHGANYSRYYRDFVKLYVNTIQPIVLEEDGSRPYLVSSPTDGTESVKEGYVAKDPGSELYGDIHYYDYLADQWNPSVFRIPRAATEYGIQSWCNAESLKGVFEEDDYDVDGAMASHRQHHAFGNQEMAAEVDVHLHPPSSPDNKTKFLDFIYLSQINQAMSMRTQTEHYRRHQAALLPDGRGLTMAALYWQLNDIWQAPTWASIDFEGQWKMLHYYSRAFFSPVLVSPYLDEDKNSLNVYLVLDEIPVSPVRTQPSGTFEFHPMTTMTEIDQSSLPLASTFKWMKTVSEAMHGYLSVHLYNYNSFKVLHSWNVDYQLKTTAESVFEIGLDSVLAQSGCPSKSDCLLYFMAVSLEGKLMSSSWMTLTYPKDANLRPANVKVVSVSLHQEPNTYAVDLSTNAIALYVWLSSANSPGRFSDNGFVMFSQKMTVYFYSRVDTTAQALKADLSVRSLMDVVR